MLKDNAVKILELMLTSREVEHREGILLRQGKSWMQVPCTGHEGLMALVYQLSREDYLFSYYRGYHLRLAKGISVEQLAKDFLVRDGSSSSGRSMSVHCGSRELNVFPDAAPVASQCLPAVGVAWAQKLKKSDNITLCSIGDGSTRQGEFYEAVCFSIQENLPIIFLVEDNGYGISTPTEKLTPLKLDVFNHKYIQEVNGRNVDEVYQVGCEAIEKVRSGQGPVILWCHVDRLSSHTLMEDHRRYRSAEELSKLIDPVKSWCKKVVEKGHLTNNEIEILRKKISTQVESIYEQVEKGPFTDLQNVHQHLYSQPKDDPKKEFLRLSTENVHTNMLTAFNQTLSDGLASQSNMLLIGQDIEDPKGGVFGLTAGLSTDYPNRVINTPIAEATILGTAVGLGVMGYKPVCEIQFIDFISPGLNQLVTHISSLNWRSSGAWPCPIVMYAPYGAYLPAGGLWHSESKEAWWTHIPGLRVAVPSSAKDCAGILATALQEDSPSLILLPKHLLRIEGPSQRIGEYIPFGKARIVREGHDVTVVAWGNCVELASAAADEINTLGKSVEIIDLRSLVPCDWETLDSSLSKTGRLVVVHEDSRTSGFGATVIAEMLAHLERFEYLWAAPQLVSRADIPIPYHPDQEHAVLPSKKDIVQAIKTVIGSTSFLDLANAP